MKVMIADDHAHARKAIRSLLATDTSFEVVKEVRSGLEAIEAMTNGC